MASIDDHGGWPALLGALLDRTHLTTEQAHAAMNTILRGDATPAQLIGFVVALRAKGETPAELAGLLDAVLEHAAIVPLGDELRSHGSVHAWVVHGGGLDELTTTGPSDVIELRDGHISHFRIDAQEFGLAQARTADLTGGEPDENAEAVRRVLAGEAGPHRDIVVLNAGAGLVVGGRATTLAEGIALARETIDSGAGAATLDRFVAASQAAAG